ncbi:tripartite tricarboxylate transporter TctB family protein [Paracoccus aurantiacus]|uniref:Tripartite tricarboxylate transporter TctB family protein n=1 Tax=Paracoccus aurantiacus TaxID=2599412 RepID=A0A5C6RYL5_9RHOB|nr:tripartite tricarboxylate transporter TctB family protein [Paracoccus aurantiacus]TXB67488.1 tripartite tricarboxylate transporter TctB family protein [Paracoccus aurantiacus]
MPQTDTHTIIDPEHHDGTSDATPGGEPTQRRPGELAFGAFLLIGSLALLWNAYGIAGFEALSSPGAIPMATSFVMVVTAALVLLRTSRLPPDRTETISRDILPPVVLIFAALLIGYGVLLRPLGFLPTSLLFLVISIKLLSRRSWAWVLMISVVCLVVIWLIFRIVFTVLMPPGIVPEAEFIQFFRNMIGGGAS